jgi:hypothetical protein
MYEGRINRSKNKAVIGRRPRAGTIAAHRPFVSADDTLGKADPKSSEPTILGDFTEA